MIELPQHLAERVAWSSGAPSPGGRYVVYWMRRAMRVHDNPALDVARHLAARLDRPLLIFQSLSERYPYANDRHHVFALQGAVDVADQCAHNELRYAFQLQRPGHREPALNELISDAACVVAEAVPVEPERRWLRKLAAAGDAAVCSVDASCVVPMPLVGEPPSRAFAFRNATAQARAARVTREWPANAPAVAPYTGALPFEPIDLAATDPFAAAAACAIDHSVAPVPGTVGGSGAGYRRWAAFRADGLGRYAAERNDPMRGAVSRLSPYLRWGMVSPLRLAREAAAADSEGASKFVDELVVWREMGWAFCYHTPSPHVFEALPEWARSTLAEHAREARNHVLDDETLARARTGDPLWDTAQRSLMVHGELHNNVRMTWGKALLGWSADPGQALRRAIELNHRYALDGCDPNSYAGILWCFGLFDRPFPPPRPVEGTVRPRPTSKHARRLDVPAWGERVAAPPGGGLRIAVVGAGIAGLAAARALQDHGHRPVVFDKGRAPGGRTATRTIGDHGFDHGAQYFTARHPALRRWIGAWQEAGVVAEWRGRLVALGPKGRRPIAGNDARYVGTPGMNALAAHLAGDLDTRQGVRMTSLERRNDAWTLRDPDGSEFGAFDRVVLTAPPPQAAALLGDASPLAASAAAFRLHPCWAVMIRFAAPLEVDFDGAFCEASALSWIARDASKPGRAGGERWVLHAGPGWSEQHLEDGPDTLAAALTEELARVTGVALPPVEHHEAHRWRYARPAADADAGCLYDAAHGLALAGDAYNGGRVEGAWLSGTAAASRILGDFARQTAAHGAGRAECA